MENKIRFNKIKEMHDEIKKTWISDAVYSTDLLDELYEEGHIGWLLDEINSLNINNQNLSKNLNEAESLLSDARSLLNNIHGYDTETYRNISKYFDGEDE